MTHDHKCWCWTSSLRTNVVCSQIPMSFSPTLHITVLPQYRLMYRFLSLELISIWVHDLDLWYIAGKNGKWWKSWTDCIPCIYVSCSYKTQNMSAKLVLRYIALNVAYHKKWFFFWNWVFDVFQCSTYRAQTHNLCWPAFFSATSSHNWPAFFSATSSISQKIELKMKLINQ